MNLPAQLILALVLGAIATALTIFIKASTPLITAAIIISATLLTALLGNLGRKQPGAKASKPAKNAKQPRQKAAASGGAREEGEVKWFNGSKGFGFIIRPNGDEIFVHFRSIRGDSNTRRSLRDGQRVSYELGNSDKGPQAEEVDAL
jgi:CspA family cold shock protein